jgi:hypothetical protein
MHTSGRCQERIGPRISTARASSLGSSRRPYGDLRDGGIDADARAERGDDLGQQQLLRPGSK